jgi:hypothetical protein
MHSTSAMRNQAPVSPSPSRLGDRAQRVRNYRCVAVAYARVWAVICGSTGRSDRAPHALLSKVRAGGRRVRGVAASVLTQSSAAADADHDALRPQDPQSSAAARAESATRSTRRVLGWHVVCEVCAPAPESALHHRWSLRCVHDRRGNAATTRHAGVTRRERGSATVCGELSLSRGARTRSAGTDLGVAKDPHHTATRWSLRFLRLAHNQEPRRCATRPRISGRVGRTLFGTHVVEEFCSSTKVTMVARRLTQRWQCCPDTEPALGSAVCASKETR